MPNHIHLIVREKLPGGISKFMLKLMTAYSMYFNTKYERSGPLFTRPFRSRHVDSDDYLRWLFSYVHLNSLELFQSDWKTQGLADNKGAAAFMCSYRYSSFSDYSDVPRAESRILEKKALPFDADELKNFDDLLALLAGEKGYQEYAPHVIGASNALV